MTNQQPEKWIKEFEEKFIADDIQDCIPEKNWEEMKGEVLNFIRQLLQQAKREEKERIEELLILSMPKTAENLSNMIPEDAKRTIGNFLKALNKEK